jgi:tetratricopeptide (TPR) repeat protein
VGVVIQNVLTQVSGETDDKLPLILRVGNSYSLLRDRVLASLDIQQSQFSGMGWNMGMEMWATRMFALRLGLEYRGEVSEADFGFGLKWKRLSLDIAMGFSELGQSQRMGLSWRFGKSNTLRIKENIKKVIDEGFELFRQGNYTSALEKLENAAAANPSDRKVTSMVEKLRSIVASVPQIKGLPAEIAGLISRGVQAYVDGDLNTSYDALRSAFEKNPSDSRLMGLTNRVAQAAGKPLVETPSAVIPPSARWTHEDQKLNDALRAIYEGRYDLAIQKCEEVLRINPNNAVALGRMGAAFFLMGEKDKAVTLWRRALEIDPNHKPAIEYLKQLGEIKEDQGQ